MTGKLPTKRKQFDEYVKPVDRALLIRRVGNVLGIIGGVFAIVSMLTFLWPDDKQADPTPGNASVPASTLVTGFARDYVTTYLTAKAGDEQKLARYVTVKDVKLPPVAGQFTDTEVAFATVTRRSWSSTGPDCAAKLSCMRSTGISMLLCPEHRNTSPTRMSCSTVAPLAANTVRS